ncbi:MAG: flagellin [Deltaproteobacteria bacterium]|nr:flagellin [Deltaproteobacteria bacterium]
MGFRIQNNIAAMNAQRNLNVSDTGLSKSLERLSSGYRINSAKDDAAGLAISQGFRADIASVKVAQRNISEANALLQTADGAMSSVGDILTRMKELATQAASANVGTNISKVDAEFDTLKTEIDRISTSTKYAGAALTTGAFTGKAFQIGYTSTAADSQISVSLANIGAASLGITAAIGVASAASASAAMTAIDAAVGSLATARGSVGSYQNRLSYAATNLSVTLENFTAAESVIRDVDMAAEMTTFTKNQILVQAGTSMLAQANMSPQNVLSLFK